MAEDDKAGTDQPRTDLGDVMFVPVDDEPHGDVLTEEQARAFMERPIRAQQAEEKAS